MNWGLEKYWVRDRLSFQAELDIRYLWMCTHWSNQSKRNLQPLISACRVAVRPLIVRYDKLRTSTKSGHNL